MSSARALCWQTAAVLTILAGMTCLLPPAATAAEKPVELSRKAKTKVAAVYPDLAKRMNITGTVKIEVLVAANGTVKTAKVLGGHPLLANAAVDAVRKWRFEAASEETSGVVEFKFASDQQ